MSGAIGSILSNFGAMEALNGIASAQGSNNTYETQLSTGLAINSPADNPAGFIEAQGFDAQINGITQASANANEGISLLQTAQGAVQQQLDIAQKLNSIAVQAANGTQTPEESQSLQAVVSQLTGQMTTIAQQTEFNNIGLLDGTFTGVQFQVGANEGQTIDLSIGSTEAGGIGLNTLNASAGSKAIYKGSGSAAATKTGSAFTAGTMTISGSDGSAKVAVTTDESAASLAEAINGLTNQTNVSAQANTAVVLKVKGGSGSAFDFTLGNGTAAAPTNPVTISATGVSGLIEAINNATATTGITASENGSGDVVLTQSQGGNISITGVKNGSFTTENTPAAGVYGGMTSGTTGTFTPAASGSSLVVQGKVSFQSDQSFSVGSAKLAGLASQSTLDPLSGINVTTVSGANSAINVIKYAIDGLNNLDGSLGAVQQRLQATLQNLTTTNTNLQNGLGVVQDANIPQVSEQLTETEIQAQAGVAALKSSTTLQQAYLSLLP